jgi:hypothetical protein
MNARWIALLLILGCTPLPAQAPAHPAQPAPRSYTNNLGFSYTFPADWDVVDMSATLPEARQQAQQSATTAAEKQGAACIQIALSARHGNPPSSVVALVLPFACLGSVMTDKDIPGMAAGAVEGIQQNFDIAEPVYGSYALGSHTVWIERVKGSLKGNPQAQYTIETVCSLVKKGAVCWMAMAADDAALATFEHGMVTLDHEAPKALVPATALDTKPAS